MPPQLVLCRRATPDAASVEAKSVHSVAARLANDETAALVARSDGALVLVSLAGGAATAPAYHGLCLQHAGGGQEEVGRPLAALECIADGVLLAQRGSGKILFFPGPLSDGENTAPVFLFGSQAGPLTCLAASPSGSLLASGDACGKLCLWGTSYGALLASAQCGSGSGSGAAGSCVVALSFLADDMVAAASSAGVVWVWQLSGASLEVHSEIRAGLQPVCLASCSSPSGQQLLAVGAEDGAVVFFVSGSGGCWQELCRLQGEGSRGPVAALSCSQAAGQLAVAHERTLSIYALPSFGSSVASPQLPLLHRHSYPAGLAGCSFLRGGGLAVFPQSSSGSSSSSLVEVLPPIAAAAAATTSCAAAATGAVKKTVRFAESSDYTGAGAGPASTAVSAAQPSSRALPPLPPHPLLQLRGGGRGAQVQLQQDQQPAGGEASLLSPSSLAAPATAAAAATAAATAQDASTNTEASVIGQRTLGSPAASAAQKPAQPAHHPPGPEEPDTEQPRPRPVPAPLRQQPRPGSAGDRHCEACAVLGPGSTSKPPPQVFTSNQATAESGQPHPPSPVKKGVCCTAADQQAGQLLPPEQQRAVVVTEHETRLAHLEVRSERMVKLSRRALVGTGEQPLTAATVAVGAEVAQPTGQAATAAAADASTAAPAQGRGEVGMSTQGVRQPGVDAAERPCGSPASPASSSSMPSTAEACCTNLRLSMGLAAASPPVPAAAPFEGTAATAAARTQQHCATGEPTIAAGSGGRPTGASHAPARAQALRQVESQLSQLDLRLGRLVEAAHQRGAQVLGEAAAAAAGAAAGHERAALAAPAAALEPLASDGGVARFCSAAQRKAGAEAAALVAKPPTSLPASAALPPEPWSLAAHPPLQQSRQQEPARAGALGAGPLQPATTAAAAARPAFVWQAARPEGRQGQQAPPFKAPGAALPPPPPEQQQQQEPPRLAVPQLNSSLLLLAAQALQPPPAPSEEALRQARVWAATAATTFPPDAVVFPPPAAGAAGAPPGGSAGAGGLPSPGRRLPVVGKQLGLRWVEERELQPRLEDLWQPPAQVARLAPVPFTVKLSPRQVAHRLLGLR